MVHQNQFIAVVTSNGKILRERNKGEVFLNYGSEYSILLKNLCPRKAVVNVSIDGEDVLNNHQLIINSNSKTCLEGFLNGNVAKNKFKFIQKTKEISNHRGDRIDDGLIRIEYVFEQPPSKKVILNESYYYHSHFPNVYGPGYHSYKTDDIYFEPSVTYCCSTNTRSCLSDNNILENHNKQDEGITVKGTEINQHFDYGYVNTLDESSRDVIIISLKGITEKGNEVKTPLTTRGKITCSTCGKKNKSFHKFCSRCGTFLE